jgi:hypothetical protein
MNRPMMIVLIAALSAQTTAEASELRSLMAAKTVAELDAKTRESAAQKLTHETCVAELAARLLPRSCFREHAGAPSARLTGICIENAKASRSRLDLSGPLNDLPAECQDASRQRIEDLRYIDEAASPSPELEETSRD